MRIQSRERSRGERATGQVSPGALKCRQKFLRFFPEGFGDQGYLETEREYKWESHLRWQQSCGQHEFAALLRAGRHEEIAARAVRIEQRSRYSMLFSFEKMALRDAVKSASGAHAFAEGLFALLHGTGELQARFEAWVGVVAKLPRKQTRVLTWPLVTVFGFIAQPDQHIFMKPQYSAHRGANLWLRARVSSYPNWGTYSRLLELAERVRRDQRALHPRDMIDIQSFLWVQGSAEYEE